MQRKLVIVLAVLFGLFGFIQLVPYGNSHGNPPVLEEPELVFPETRAMVQ